VIKADLMAAIILTVQQGDVMGLRLLNAAFITLIPKKNVVLAAKDVRPINLVHSFGKLLTKILANRVAPILDSLISTNQSAFICGRCIHDNFISAANS
jgi:hypothetical protein